MDGPITDQSLRPKAVLGAGLRCPGVWRQIVSQIVERVIFRDHAVKDVPLRILAFGLGIEVAHGLIERIGRCGRAGASTEHRVCWKGPLRRQGQGTAGPSQG